MDKILITGGTGLIGRNLSKKLADKGYEIRILSRKSSKDNIYPTYKWDINTNYIDTEALKDIDYIVHLAGENLGAGRWTKKRKQKIIDSRVKGSELILNTIKTLDVKPKAFISASAVGIYPSFKDSEEYYIEKDMYGTGFTSEVCIAWEDAADKFKDLGIRTVKIRTGIVQDKNDPALKKILQVSKFGFLPVFGTGKHYYPWIHIDDLTELYITAIENKDFNDPFNAVAPHQVTNFEYIRSIKKVRNGKGIIIRIPEFLLRIMFGEMTDVVVKGTKIQSKLHKKDKFEFKFETIEEAMYDLIK
ncbi:MAG: TIGR01777 family oxidoreductase [Bacteroidales bacterium]|nr:TIGR01777 family oxidoreductase [Bacteroidales bacterium]